MQAPSTLERLQAGRRARTARFLTVTIILGVIAIALWWTMVLVGDVIYSFGEVFAVMRGEQVAGASFSIGTLRIPRATAGLLAGLAFGAGGYLFQTILRNSLASPDVIGITSGASASAVFAILVLGLSGAAVSAISVICGLATALVIYLLSSGRGGLGSRLILIGIGVAAMFNAVISYLMLQGDAYDLPKALRWLSGSLNGISWDSIPMLAIAVVVFGGILLANASKLGPLELGEDAAVALGVPVNRTRLSLILAGVALVAFATATTGPIAFVAFLSGPIVTRLVRHTGRSLLVPSAFMGAILVLASDLIGQFAFTTNFPVGVITGVLGAPYLIYLLVRQNAQGAST
ncbi:iron chelate uptake ABC transporter family permease subunit [Gulosibacter chungangensis]|uniref:Iron chelate uptake ABC transporter family permease subunit n=1 Tax=Gulosibacter chungangensis TaxID=979746 RepID=A0A7J5B8P9_9MICO|nr:iron chelate uptake ABC transporter family permease subunit [Gulosibacter chungangensis]